MTLRVELNEALAKLRDWDFQIAVHIPGFDAIVVGQTGVWTVFLTDDRAIAWHRSMELIETIAPIVPAPVMVVPGTKRTETVQNIHLISPDELFGVVTRSPVTYGWDELDPAIARLNQLIPAEWRKR